MKKIKKLPFELSKKQKKNALKFASYYLPDSLNVKKRRTHDDIYLVNRYKLKKVHNEETLFGKQKDVCQFIKTKEKR